MTNDEFDGWSDRWMVGAKLGCSRGVASIIRDKALLIPAARADALMRHYTDRRTRDGVKGQAAVGLLLTMLDEAGPKREPVDPDQGTPADSIGFTTGVRKFMQAVHERERAHGSYTVRVRWMDPRPDWCAHQVVAGLACNPKTRRYMLALLDGDMKRYVATEQIAELELCEEIQREETA